MERRRYRSMLAQAISRRNLWAGLALLLAASNAALAMRLATVETYEKTIIVPPDIERPFWVKGPEASPEYLEQMALWYAGLAMTFSPASLPRQVQTLLRHADPRYYGALSARLAEDLERVRRTQISQVFYVSAVQRRGSRVALRGDVVAWVGSKRAASRRTAVLVGMRMAGGRLVVTELKEVDHDDPFGDRRGGGAGSAPGRG